MKSIFFCIICIYTFFLPSISFATSAKDFHYSHQVTFSKNLTHNWFTDIVEIEEDDFHEFEFKNSTYRQNPKFNSFSFSKKGINHSLKRILDQNKLLYHSSPLFILHQVFSI